VDVLLIYCFLTPPHSKFIISFYQNNLTMSIRNNTYFSISHPRFWSEIEAPVKFIRYPESLTLYFKPMPTKKLRDNPAARETGDIHVYKYTGIQEYMLGGDGDRRGKLTIFIFRFTI
jgi:hypothetical protein